MWPDRVSNPGPPTYESGALPIALRGPTFTKDILDHCDERKDLKKKRYETEGAKQYREANKRIQ